MKKGLTFSGIMGAITAVVIAAYTYLFSQHSLSVQIGIYLFTLILFLGSSWFYHKFLLRVLIRKIKKLRLFEIVVVLLANLILWALFVTLVNIDIPLPYFTRTLKFQIPENAGKNHPVENICIAEVKINGNRIANWFFAETNGDWQETTQGYLCALQPGSTLTYTTPETSEKIVAEILFSTGPTNDIIFVKTGFHYHPVDLFENQPGDKLLLLDFPLMGYWHDFIYMLDILLFGFLNQIVGFLLIPPLVKSISSANWFQVVCARDQFGKLIFSTSLLVAIILLLLARTSFYGDSLSYYSIAKAIKETGGFAPNYYGWAYPLLMVISGLFLFESFVPLFILQALTAASMPYIVYKIVKIVYPPAALIGGIVSICSLVPFLFEKYVLVETATMFFSLLAVYFSALFLQSGRNCYIYFAIFISVFVGWIRPDTSLWWVIFVFVFWISKPKKYLHYLLNIVLIIIIVAFGKINSGDKNQTSSAASYIGVTLFSSVYLTAGSISAPGDIILSPENGPGTAAMIETISHFLEDEERFNNYMNYYAIWAGPEPEYGFFLGQYKNDPDGLIDSIASEPVILYWHMLRNFLASTLELQEADDLFMQVSMESIRDRPLIVVVDMARDIKGFFFGPYRTPTNAVDRSGRWYNTYTPNPFMQEIIDDQYLTSDKMKNSLRWGIKSDRIIEVAMKFEKGWMAIFPIFRALVSSFMLIGLVFVIKHKQINSIYLLAILLIFYKALVTGILSSAIYRYVAPTLLIEVVLASISAVLIMNGIKQLPGKSIMSLLKQNHS